MVYTSIDQQELKKPKWAQDDEDNWYGVQDARERKKIQDRLAQRARRKRLSESAKKQKAVRSEGSESSECLSMPFSDEYAASFTPDEVETILVELEGSSTALELFDNDKFCEDVQVSSASPALLPAAWLQNSLENWIPPMTTDHHVFPRPTITVYAALYRHGAMLGISCECTTDAKSLPALPGVPEILHPTPLQMTISHRQWIDRFPFPRMRENMIKLNGIIDYEEFVADLFVMTSFTIKSGSLSWDPAAWKMGTEFGIKWGYLFY